MLNDQVVEKNRTHMLPWWLARLLLFFVLSMAGLTAIAAHAEDGSIGKGGAEITDGQRETSAWSNASCRKSMVVRPAIDRAK